jgi:hypothetical protein
VPEDGIAGRRELQAHVVAAEAGFGAEGRLAAGGGVERTAEREGS